MDKTNNLRKDFLENGYCILENAFNPSEVKELLAQTKRVLNEDDGSDDFLRINESKHIHNV